MDPILINDDIESFVKLGFSLGLCEMVLQDLTGLTDRQIKKMLSGIKQGSNQFEKHQ